MKIKVADEVWVAAALLHRENSTRDDFSTGEIIDRVAKENINGAFRPGIIVHVQLHCVANKRPNPANYRLLYETGRGRRRLFKQGDDYHPYRQGGKTHPVPEEIPDQYRSLVNWYRSYYK